MKICASLSSVSDIELIKKADMAEVRMDLLGHVPDIKGKELIVTFRGTPDLTVLPKGFKGMIDVGEYDVPDVDVDVISSFHDHESTPSAEKIISLLKKQKGDVKKGAFKVNSFTDLKSIYDASKQIKERHVLLGMGGLGTVTRIRQDILGNLFTFAYVGEPTAPGQLSLDEMHGLGDDPMIVGILGNPLEKSLSPKMHNAVMKKKGVKGIYLKFEADDLKHVKDAVRDYNIRGMNVTIPYKSAILEHLDHYDEDVGSIGAANTVVNEKGVLKGYNTDMIGIEKAMKVAGFEPKGKRALIMGSGGAARACSYTLKKRGCEVTIAGRNEGTSRSICRDIGCEYKANTSVALMLYDLIVNCTPVGMYGDGDYPVNTCQITRHHTVFDMVYGVETPLIKRARVREAVIVSGEDMLAAQGAASLELWTGKKNLFKPMREALR
ncbi:shikimate dehydrogenase [Candidatus Methanoplasma termitum]|uniref:Shikimate dehydrogenase (NADP(+)) n=1 Tax=Candidatus Methanoplasma termitum TaxID=1577791 RepID=A0A0A7LCX0_9ARCH|nr:shikimate dehydrogenase [Candidatus Methanoplasma termitum]AIZ56858.1 shikimate dehydrogenase [Candidatus Methanoplasma termitum]MCL2333202.1 shikimate dehydrogenase [Candidatus Methanoplasma sp.]